MARVQLTEDDGFFKNDGKGREVIQWHVSHNFPVKVGDTVTLEGREVTIEAIGSPFTPRGGKGNWCYLYPTAPKPVVREAASFTGDSSLDAFEAERIAEQGRTGELPGA